MGNTILILILILFLGCSVDDKKENTMDFNKLHDKIEKLKVKHHLVDVKFDTEYIYNPGDLSDLLKRILETTLPEKRVTVNETLSSNGNFYIATLTNQDTTIQVSTPADSDWLSEDFMDKVYNLLELLNSNKRFALINQVITVQDVWLFC